mgnify:CR=1 FL=1
MPDRNQILALVIETTTALAEDFEIDDLAQVDENSRLYGKGAPLDSMALVNLLADIEDAVADTFDASISLADERAMSARNSPFRDVRSLVDAINERLEP